ncbi:hypothetical protein [Petropleomorpha daqingensis]|uniref:Vacuolar-type H+-ATPase subunit I/STV1 n=1 Tax=Petropleomorpha daqingensis TaxID=2026353 RepID=A0A853CKI1_9ACTN|nr:hypothetical protein [Petropleomorpha daqingensis]NYJ08270.1 vacuolar-type H+-ATPase subunit I/STV1 [Petropleomorpha daqingensis]
MNAELDADRERPTLSGDLPTVLEAAPMFRRAPLGYDRFQVDTYVRWAEDELATAEREREHLEARQHRTSAALDDARELLSHSAGGADFLRLSRRMGTLLAAATDEAEEIRAEAEAHAARSAAEAERALAEAGAEAAGIVAAAVGRAEELAARAGQLVAEADQTREDARAELAAHRTTARAVRQRADRHADQVRQRAEQDAAAALAQARQDVVALLSTGRDERRRADAAAAATRARLDAEVERLEQRRAALLADLARIAERVPTAPVPQRRRVRGQLEWLRAHLRSRVTS